MPAQPSGGRGRPPHFSKLHSPGILLFCLEPDQVSVVTQLPWIPGVPSCERSKLEEEENGIRKRPNPPRRESRRLGVGCDGADLQAGTIVPVVIRLRYAVPARHLRAAAYPP